MGQLTHPVVSSLILFLCKIATFAYHVIDRFVSITTAAVLLCLIYFYFDVVGPYGFILYCY